MAANGEKCPSCSTENDGANLLYANTGKGKYYFKCKSCGEDFIVENNSLKEKVDENGSTLVNDGNEIKNEKKIVEEILKLIPGDIKTGKLTFNDFLNELECREILVCWKCKSPVPLLKLDYVDVGKNVIIFRCDKCNNKGSRSIRGNGIDEKITSKIDFLDYEDVRKKYLVFLKYKGTAISTYEKKIEECAICGRNVYAGMIEEMPGFKACHSCYTSFLSVPCGTCGKRVKKYTAFQLKKMAGKSCIECLEKMEKCSSCNGLYIDGTLTNGKCIFCAAENI